jgi:hypothetical protein
MPDFSAMADAAIIPKKVIAELQKRKAGLIAYCQIKLESGDWHAVQDAASDIREIEAKLEILRDGK